MEEPRRIVVHRSLNRPHLLLGAERSLVLAVGVLTALLVFSGSISATSLALAAAFWVSAFWSLTRMAKADPQMSQVYQRHIRFRAYYGAHSCVDAPVRGQSSKA